MERERDGKMTNGRNAQINKNSRASERGQPTDRKKKKQKEKEEEEEELKGNNIRTDRRRNKGNKNRTDRRCHVV